MGIHEEDDTGWSGIPQLEAAHIGFPQAIQCYPAWRGRHVTLGTPDRPTQSPGPPLSSLVFKWSVEQHDSG